MRARRIAPPTPYTMRFPSSLTSNRRHHMSPLVPSHIAHSRGSDQSACVGRATTVPAIIVSVAAVALLASAHAFGHAAKTSSPMAQAHHACAIVLGLSPPGYRYETCIGSLDRSVSEWDQAPYANFRNEALGWLS
jgi:hypothetical protein